VLSPTVSDYLTIGQPDLRYTYDQLPEDQRRVLDQLMDANGNSVFLASVRVRVKNMAVKQGYIEKAEFVPFTIQPGSVTGHYGFCVFEWLHEAERFLDRNNIAGPVLCRITDRLLMLVAVTWMDDEFRDALEAP